jgi:hypothetical protein
MSLRTEAALEQPEVFIEAAGDFAEYIGDVEQGKAPFEPFDDLTNFFKANVEQLYHVSLDGTPTTPEQR